MRKIIQTPEERRTKYKFLRFAGVSTDNARMLRDTSYTNIARRLKYYIGEKNENINNRT